MFEDIFHRRKLNIEKLQSFGFEMRNGSFEYTVPIMNEAFLLTVLVTKNGNVDTRLVEKETDEPYVLYKTSAAGSFVGEVRTEIGSVLSEIAGKCFDFPFSKTTKRLRLSIMFGIHTVMNLNIYGKSFPTMPYGEEKTTKNGTAQFLPYRDASWDSRPMKFLKL